MYISLTLCMYMCMCAFLISIQTVRYNKEHLRRAYQTATEASELRTLQRAAGARCDTTD